MTQPTPVSTDDAKGLKACPFCGEEVRLVTNHVAGESDWIEHFPRIGALECGLEFTGFNLTGGLAEAWNTRAQPLPSDEDTVEAVLKIIPLVDVDLVMRVFGCSRKEALFKVSSAISYLTDAQAAITAYLASGGNIAEGLRLPYCADSFRKARSMTQPINPTPEQIEEIAWRDIGDKPAEPMGVLLYVPDEAHTGVSVGQDYRVQIGFWNGTTFCEQGTGHDFRDRLPEFGGVGGYPTRWMPLPSPPNPLTEPLGETNDE